MLVCYNSKRTARAYAFHERRGVPGDIGHARRYRNELLASYVPAMSCWPIMFPHDERDQ
jgi:hypothetical protein